MHINEGEVLVGRKRSLEKLFLKWEKTKIGKGSTILISGEVGIGKTTLVNQFISLIGDEEKILFRGQGYEEVPSPLFTFGEMIRDHLKSLKYSESRDFMTKYLKNIAKVIPKFGNIIVPILFYRKEDYISDELKRYISGDETEYFFNYLTLLEKISDKKPTILFIDDMQWLDISSMRLLSYLTNKVSSKKILIICAFRSQYISGERDEKIQIQIERLRSTPQRDILEINLEKFPEEDYPLLIYNLLPGEHRFNGTEIKTLYDETEGNPLFLDAVLAMLTEENIIGKSGEYYVFQRKLDRGIIPKTVELTVKKRLIKIYDDLPESKDLLDHAAVMGLKFEADEIIGLTKKNTSFVLDLLNRIENKYFLIRKFRQKYAYKFDHKKTQEVIYNNLGNLLPSYHLEIAKYLEDVAKEAPDFFLIAYHYKKGKEWKKSLEYLEKSAKIAFDLYLYVESSKHYREFLTILHDQQIFIPLEKIKEIKLSYFLSLYYSNEKEKALIKLLDFLDSQFKLTVAEKATICSYIARCYYMDGRGDTVDKSFGYYKKAIKLFSELEDSSKVAENYLLLAASYDHIGRYGLVKNSIDRSLKIYSEIGDLIGKAIAIRKSFMYYDYGDFDDEIKNSLKVLEENGLKKEVGKFYNNLGLEYFSKKDLKVAEEYFINCVICFEELNSFEIDFPLNNLGVIKQSLGQYESAMGLFHKALDRHSEEFNRIFINNNIAINFLLTGRKKQALEIMLNIKSAFDDFHDPYLQDRCYFNLGVIYSKNNKIDKAVECIEKSFTFHVQLKTMPDPLYDKKIRFLRKLIEQSNRSEKSRVLKYIPEKMYLDKKKKEPWYYAEMDYLPCLIAYFE